MEKKLNLNLGCGDQILPGFLNVDANSNKDVVFDDVVFLINFSDNGTDMIYAAHVLQCIFPRSRVLIALENWYKVLKPGGHIIIEVPDIVPVTKAYLEGKVPIETFIQGIYGVDKDGIRQTICFSFDYLKKLLEEVGFKNIKRIDQPSYSRHCKETNICVEAEK